MGRALNLASHHVFSQNFQNQVIPGQETKAKSPIPQSRWKLVTKSGNTPKGDTGGELSWVYNELQQVMHVFMLYHGKQLVVLTYQGENVNTSWTVGHFKLGIWFFHFLCLKNEFSNNYVKPFLKRSYTVRYTLEYKTG
jgi:hypothetical protein